MTLSCRKSSGSDGLSPPKPLHLFLSVGHVPGLEIHLWAQQIQTLSLQSSDGQTNSDGHRNPLGYSVCLLPLAAEQLLEVTALNRHSNYLLFWRSEVQTGNPSIKTAVLSGCVPPYLSGEISPLTFSSFYKPFPSSKPAVTALQRLLSSHMCSGCVFPASLFHS